MEEGGKVQSFLSADQHFAFKVFFGICLRVGISFVLLFYPKLFISALSSFKLVGWIGWLVVGWSFIISLSTR